MFVNGQPLCIGCDADPERRRQPRKITPTAVPPSDPGRHKTERRILIARYTSAVQEYRSAVLELSRAAGSQELDMFNRLSARCGVSREACVGLRKELIRLSN